MREGVGKAWFAHRVAADPAATGMHPRPMCAALLRVDGVRAKLDAAATEWVSEQLDRFRVEILNTTGATRDAFTRVQEQTSSPEAVTVQLRDNERAATKDQQGHDLPRYSGHLFADGAGHVPRRSERVGAPGGRGGVRPAGFVAWYRNPGSATPASLRIAYRTTQGSGPRFSRTSSSCRGGQTGRSARPSSTRTATTLPMPGPSSGPWLEFAERYGARFIRIDSVAKVEDGSLRVLDLGDPVFGPTYWRSRVAK